MLDAALGDEYQHHVRGGGADLPAYASAAKLDENWIAEVSGAITYRQHAAAKAPTENERALDHLGNHRHAIGPLQQPGGNILIRRVPQLLQHLRCSNQSRILTRRLMRLSARRSDR